MKLLLKKGIELLHSKKLLTYHIDTDHVQSFQEQLEIYKSKITKSIEDNEHEEHFKNEFNDWLKQVYSYDINTHKRIDSIIRDKGEIKAIIEVKRPSNTIEMISDTNINCKAFQEALLYYYEERQINTSSINEIIITDCKKVYLFSSNEFETLITNKAIKKLLHGYKNKELEIIQTTTDVYYELSNLLDVIDYEIKGCMIDLFDNNIDIETVYRLFDRHFLFNLAIENKDHNILDKAFYNELLYIMGLHETTNDKKTPIIKHCHINDPNNCSLMTMVLNQIDHTKIDPQSWLSLGETQEERAENLALDLVLTWINRILFLKLLEAQLIKYHQGGKEKYQFLDYQKLNDWDDVYTLFFEILAKPLSDPNRKNREIPYLNSSLFEATKWESIIAINSLKNKDKLAIYSNSVLTDKTPRPLLQYLLAFLDAYNFGTGDKELSKNKRLINASVLGLIFEKLNGYKDGAVYTPGFITMSMSRESLQRVVIQKFNDTYQWDCQTISDLHNKMIRNDLPLLEVNRVFNSIRICDPAVGSGHFLVSVLNELLLLKYQLKILCDRQGNIISHCDINIEYDELFIIYNGKVFNYEVDKNNKALSADVQILQETLFHEKETLIENSLFGVDINPKSSYICQLRLWIELLKNTYYIQQPLFDSSNGGRIEDLQTLPNIDINIKTGNSLVSRFGLKQDFSLILNALRGRGISMKRYREWVYQYKNAHNKEEKNQARTEIENIKKTLKEKFLSNDPNYDRLLSNYKTAQTKYENAERDIFGTDQTTLDELKTKITDAKKKLDQTDNLYHHSMEWRYEFPEVLDDEGNFIGFDLVIGNPPYIALQSLKGSTKSIYKELFTTHASTGDIYQLFMELAYNIINQHGIVSLITSNKWMRAGYGESTRKWLYEYAHTEEVIDLGAGCFDNVTVDTNIIRYRKRQDEPQQQIHAYIMDKSIKNLFLEKKNRQPLVINTTSEGSSWIILNDIEASILDKMKRVGKPLKDWDISINYGIKTGFNEAFIIDGTTKDRLIAEDSRSAEIIKPLLRGRDIKRYTHEFADKWIILAKYESHVYLESQYPAIYKRLLLYKEQLENRGQCRYSRGGKEQGQHHWLELDNNPKDSYLEKFEKPKVIYPNMTKFLPFIYDNAKFYTNQKCFIITHRNNNTNQLQFMIGYMNSLISHFWIRCICPELQGGTRELSSIFFENLPIPIFTQEQEKMITNLVQSILSKKEQLLSTEDEEQQIDNLVYSLYGLTEEEIGICQGDKFAMAEST